MFIKVFFSCNLKFYHCTNDILYVFLNKNLWKSCCGASRPAKADVNILKGFNNIAILPINLSRFLKKSDNNLDGVNL